MNSFLFFFIIFILIICYIAVRNYGMTEEFLSDFTKKDIKNVERNLNAFIPLRGPDFYDCTLRRRPTPIKTNFV
jgi:hypothetical protein